jgi:hypothetical protein
LAEGLRAYAAEHTVLENMLCNKLKKKWLDVQGRAKAVLASLTTCQLPESFTDTSIDVELEGYDD